MDSLSRLEALKKVADKLSIAIVTANLFDSEITIQSGYCKVQGQKMIFLDKLLTIEEQSEVILQTLKKFNLETTYLPPWIREHIESKNIRDQI